MYLKANIKFVDISSSSLNVDLDQLEAAITEKTKAIVVVHYGGYPLDLDRLKLISDTYGIPVIQDGAHAFGMRWNGKPMSSFSQFTMYSFQAIKHITTGDGGMVLINADSATRLHEIQEKPDVSVGLGLTVQKQSGIWENDITELGYKYQMTDLGASLGLSALKHSDEIILHRNRLLRIYQEYLRNIPGIHYFAGEPTPDSHEYVHAAWLCTVLVENRRDLQAKLLESNIESNQVHYRNDRYSIFKHCLKDKTSFPNMDAVEDKYLVLPLHMEMSERDVVRVCEVIRSGW